MKTVCELLLRVAMAQLGGKNYFFQLHQNSVFYIKEMFLQELKPGSYCKRFYLTDDPVIFRTLV